MTEHVQTTENTVEQPEQGKVKVKKRGTLRRIKDKIKSKFHRHKKEKVVKNEVQGQDHIKDDQSSSDESDESGREAHPDDRDLGTTQGTGQGPILGSNPSQSPIHERDFMTSHPELISDKSQYTEKSVPEKDLTSRPETGATQIGLTDIPSTAPIIIRRRSICNERQLQHAMTKLRHTEVPNSGLHEGVKIEYLQEKKAALSAALIEDMERLHLTHVAGAPDGSVSDKVKAAYVEEQLAHAIKDDLKRTSLAHVSNPPDGSISDKVKAAYVEEQLIHAIQDDTTRTSLTHVSNPPDGRVSEQAKAAFLEEQKAKGIYLAPPSGLREGVEAAYLGAYLEAQDQKAKDQVPIIHTTSTEDVAIRPKSENGLRPGVQAAYLGAYLEAQEEKAKLAGTGDHMRVFGDEIPIKQVKEDGFVHPGVQTAYLAGYLEAQDELHGGAKVLPEEKGFGQKLMEGIQHVAQTAAEGIHSVALTAAGMLHAPQETDAPVTGSHSRETVTTL